jgi:uncharacterized membrane protein YfcA
VSTHDILVTVTGGILGGALNAMAAGGGVVAFLFLTMAGLPAQAANAVNLVAMPASFVGTLPTAWHTRRQLRVGWSGLLAAGAGTAIGVGLSTMVPAAIFRGATPVLLMAAAGLLLVQPSMPGLVNDHLRRPRDRVHQGWIAAALFATSIYAGAFGGGVGVLVLLVFGLLTSWSFEEASVAKNLVCLWTSGMGAVLYAVFGHVSWQPAAWLAAGFLVGGLLGDLLRRKLSETTLRSTVAIVTAFGAGHLV